MARESVSPDPADIRIRDLETKLEEEQTVRQELEEQLANLTKQLEESRSGEQSLLDDLQRMEAALAQERRLVLEREEEILYLQEQLVEQVDQEEAERRRQSSLGRRKSLLGQELEQYKARLATLELTAERERVMRVEIEERWQTELKLRTDLEVKVRDQEVTIANSHGIHNIVDENAVVADENAMTKAKDPAMTEAKDPAMTKAKEQSLSNYDNSILLRGMRETVSAINAQLCRLLK